MPKGLHYDIQFHEWLYDVLVNLTSEQKSALNNREIAKIRNRSEVKRFIGKSKIEEVEVLLTKVGVECSRIFYAPKKLDANIIKETYRQYTMKGKPVENLVEMVKQKLFVTHSRDIALSLSMMSANCHSLQYKVNTEFLRVKEAVNNLKAKKIQASNLNRQIIESMASYKVITKVLLFALGLDAYIEGKYDLLPVDIMILMVLMQYPNNYVSMDFIVRNLDHKYKRTVLVKRGGYLFREKQYIDKMPAKQNTPSYRITQTGMLVVGELVDWVVKSEVR